MRCSKNNCKIKITTIIKMNKMVKNKNNFKNIY